MGYHAAAADHGVLAHTTSLTLAAVWLNGAPASEAMLYGAYAGSLGVPVILLSGDDVTERSCGGLFAGAPFVRFKTALGQRSARSLAPSVACDRIRAAAADAVRNVASVVPYRVAEPCQLAIELANVTQAELCGFVPGARRMDARTVGFDCATVVDPSGG